MVPFSSRRVPSLPSFSSRPAFPIPSCQQQGFKCLTTGWRPQRAACCCKELGVAALRLPHNVAGLPPQRDNLGHSQVRVSSQHPAQLTAFSRRENLARPVGCQNRRPARWRPTLTVLQTQPKGGSASCGGNFKTQHHNTLTLLGIFILDTMAPHIRKYVTRLYCWSARSFQRAPPLRRWQLGFVMASAATCQGGGSDVAWTHQSALRTSSTFTGFPLGSGTCGAAHRTLAASKASAGLVRVQAELVGSLPSHTSQLKRRS